MRRWVAMPVDRSTRAGLAHLAAVLGMIMPFWVAAARAEVAPPSVQITGEARETRMADRATMMLRVEATAASSEEATRDLTARVNRVLPVLKAAGIAEADTESDGPMVQAVYEAVRDERSREVAEKRRRTGFSAQYGLTVMMGDLGAIPALLPRLAEAGAMVQAVNFSLKEARALQISLEERAVADALDRAKRLVAAAGAKPGRVLGIAVERGSADLPYRSARALAAPAPEPETRLPVRPGRITVEARVGVTLEIVMP